jgi:hypothetical protein
MTSYAQKDTRSRLQRRIAREEKARAAPNPEEKPRSEMPHFFRASGGRGANAHKYRRAT